MGYGSGQYIINGTGIRLGPYSDAEANHSDLQSGFFREGELDGSSNRYL
jgi:hypothetical protein